MFLSSEGVSLALVNPLFTLRAGSPRLVESKSFSSLNNPTTSLDNADCLLEIGLMFAEIP